MGCSIAQATARITKCQKVLMFNIYNAYSTFTFHVNLVPWLCEWIARFTPWVYIWKFMVKVCATSCKSTWMCAFFALVFSYSATVPLYIVSFSRVSKALLHLDVYWNQFTHCTHTHTYIYIANDWLRGMF